MIFMEGFRPGLCLFVYVCRGLGLPLSGLVLSCPVPSCLCCVSNKHCMVATFVSRIPLLAFPGNALALLDLLVLTFWLTSVLGTFLMRRGEPRSTQWLAWLSLETLFAASTAYILVASMVPFAVVLRGKACPFRSSLYLDPNLKQNECRSAIASHSVHPNAVGVLVCSATLHNLAAAGCSKVDIRSILRIRLMPEASPTLDPETQPGSTLFWKLTAAKPAHKNTNCRCKRALSQSCVLLRMDRLNLPLLEREESY